VSKKAGTLQGIISATRDILTVGAELSLVGEQAQLVRTMTELGVNAAVVVALSVALVLVRRYVRLDRV
jgi:flagellar biosynthesis component FlhA